MFVIFRRAKVFCTLTQIKDDSYRKYVERERGELDRERERERRKGERTGKAPSRCYVPVTTEREIKREHESEI